jgi:hypothetical protein
MTVPFMANANQKCPHSFIESALDRWVESHWYIHHIEANYHSCDLFRYSVNSFIRSIKEIPQLFHMELQNHSSYKTHFKPVIRSIYEDSLLAVLHPLPCVPKGIK